MRRVFGGAIAACLVAITMSPAQSAEIPAKDRTVILLSIDGFPAWMWRDPYLVAPHLKQLARDGATAEAMSVSNPSITWINHTTMVTGVEPRKHGVLYNGLLVRGAEDLPPRVEPWVDRSRLVRAPTLYDAVATAGLTSAEVDWVAVTNTGTINWSFPELPTSSGIIEREMIAAGQLTVEQVEGFKKANVAWRDMIWTKAACHILNKHRPNLLLLHWLNTDAVNHANGPGSHASFTAYAYADRLVGDLLACLKEAGIAEKTTILVTTDHGFKKVKKLILPNVALREAGLIRTAGPKILSCDAYAVTQGGLAMVFVTDPDKKDELLPKVRQLCSNLEGIDRVLDGNEGHALGMPTPRENQGVGDLILYAKADYAFQAPAEGSNSIIPTVNYLGTHGYANSDPDLDGIFLAWGYGIKRGVKLTRVTNLDIAPTLAEILGVKIGAVDGRVVNEILTR